MIKHTNFLNFLLIVPCSICAHNMVTFALPAELCSYVYYQVVTNGSRTTFY